MVLNVIAWLCTNYDFLFRSSVFETIWQIAKLNSTLFSLLLLWTLQYVEQPSFMLHARCQNPLLAIRKCSIDFILMYRSSLGLATSVCAWCMTHVLVYQTRNPCMQFK